MRPMSCLVLAALLTASACDDPATAEQWSRVSVEFDEAVAELAELSDEVGELVALQASRLGETLDVKLEELDVRLDEMSESVAAASEVAQRKYSDAMKVVAAKRVLLELRLEELGESSGAAADELRAGVVAAYEELVVAMGQARDAWQAEPVSGEVR